MNYEAHRMDRSPQDGQKPKGWAEAHSTDRSPSIEVVALTLRLFLKSPQALLQIGQKQADLGPAKI